MTRGPIGDRVATITTNLTERLYRITELTGLALTHLDQWAGGYAPSTPGARPSSTPAPLADPDDPHDTAGRLIRLTQPEGGAERPDPHLADRTRLLDLLERLDRDTHTLDALITRYGITRLGATERADLDARIDAMWCPHCAAVGNMRPKEKGYTSCSWCRKFIAAHKQAPPRFLLEIRRDRGTVTETDYARWRATLTDDDTLDPVHDVEDAPRRGEPSARFRRDLAALERGTATESAAELAARFTTTQETTP